VKRASAQGFLGFSARLSATFGDGAGDIAFQRGRQYAYDRNSNNQGIR
jgi:hypothetical protein